MSACRARRTSATRRAIGPCTFINCTASGQSWLGTKPASGTRPADGRIDAMPQAPAGLRKEPPISLPSPTALMPVASAAASPPLDPPAVRSRFHGLRVRPCRLLSVCTRSAMSGRLVRPIGMAPAARILSTTGASKGTTAPASAGTPQVVGSPAMSMFSFTVQGTPCSRPTGSPAASLRSAAAAAVRASSASTRTIAFTSGLTRSMRAKWASTTSRAETCLLPTRRAKSAALPKLCHVSPPVRVRAVFTAGSRGSRNAPGRSTLFQFTPGAQVSAG